jgi:nonsense-mediated mRNA decay protein 3
MSLNDLVCPSCGILSSKKKFIGMFCIDCHTRRQMERITLPEVIEVLQCKRCGRMVIKKWSERIEALKEEIPSLFKKLKTVVLEITPEECELEFVFEDMTFQKRIPVKMHRTLCDDCTRIARGYFEATIQVRGDKEKIGKMVEKLVRNLKKKTFITSVNELREGIDIKVGSTEATRAVLSGKKYLATKELYGAKEGKQIFRTTFLIRV